MEEWRAHGEIEGGSRRSEEGRLAAQFTPQITYLISVATRDIQCTSKVYTAKPTLVFEWRDLASCCTEDLVHQRQQRQRMEATDAMEARSIAHLSHRSHP